MPQMTRLQLPLDQSGDPTGLPALTAAHPARLLVGRRGVLLLIEAPTADSPNWRCPVRAEWLPVLTSTFAPMVDGFGMLRVRPARAVLGCSTTDLIIDLFPTAGARISVGSASGLDFATWTERVPPVAAAMVLACTSLPASAATYEVRQGDTLSSISRTLFGRTSTWRQLFARNRHQLADPDKLAPGMILQVPDTQQAAPPPMATGVHHVTVAPGDTLFSLAKRHLGDGAKWRTLWAGIRQRVADPSHLPIGLQVPLPAEMAVNQSDVTDQALPPVQVVVVPSPVAPISGPTPANMTSPEAVVPGVAPTEEPPPPIAAVPSPTDPVPATLPPASPVFVPPSPLLAAIERPFNSHLGVSFDPVTYHESVAPQQVTARGTIFNSFGAEAGWRIADLVEVSGQYLFNGYPMTRVQPAEDRRTEHHGRLTGYVVWPLLPHLELAAGMGGQMAGYGVAAGPPIERPEDVYDSGYQRLLVHGEAKVGWRPWPDRPLTVTASVSAIPFGQGFRLGGTEPMRLWGFGWTTGLRYSLQGFAVETSYRGQRVFGDSYGQSSDLLHAGVAYYFR